MKKLLFFAAIAAVALWVVFAALLLGAYKPTWLPNAFATLTKPVSLADFGQAFSAFEGFVSSFALMLGLIAIAIQVRQNTDSNVIGAMSARHCSRRFVPCLEANWAVAGLSMSGHGGG